MRPIRRAWDSLPPFPRLPTPRRIARWWRNEGAEVLPSPRLPSASDIASSWRERRHLRILPPLPKIPSPKTIATGVRHRFSKDYHGAGTSIPSPTEMLSSFQEQPLARRRKILLGILGVVS